MDGAYLPATLVTLCVSLLHTCFSLTCYIRKLGDNLLGAMDKEMLKLLKSLKQLCVVFFSGSMMAAADS